MTISNAMIQFNPSQVNLKFNATIGKSDLSVTEYWKILWLYF
jgi:hypothetical protein